jgi:UDP-2,3-diacylglucosamine pyrophosphatase LpxH
MIDSVACAVVSDIHIRRNTDANYRLLVDLISNWEPVPKTFVLLGDIFDFFLGGSSYFESKFEELGSALSLMAARGARVLFVEGNHEFGLGDLSWQGVEVIDAVDVQVSLDGQSSLRLTHGDLLSRDPSYQLFRRLTKSRLCIAIARGIPGKLLDQYTLKHAAISRSMDRPVNHGKVLANAAQWANQDHGTRAAYHVFGHYHVPYADVWAGAKLYCLPCWDDCPNVLVFRRGQILRLMWDQPRKQWIEVRPKAVVAGNP